jgi:hypothetical protein
MEIYSQFKERNAGLIRVEINDNLINKPSDIAEAFSKYFPSICNGSYPGTLPFINQSMEFLSFTPETDAAN